MKNDINEKQNIRRLLFGILNVENSTEVEKNTLVPKTKEEIKQIWQERRKLKGEVCNNSFHEKSAIIHHQVFYL